MGEGVIKLLLLLMPGLVAIYIYRVISGSYKTKTDQLEWLFSALVFNIPAFTLTWVILWEANRAFVKWNLTSSWDINSLSALSYKLDSLSFVLLYVLISSCSGLLVGYILASEINQGSARYRFLSWLRKTQGKADMLGAPSPWHKFVYNRDEPVIEIIRKDGERVKGFLRDFSLGNDNRELTLDYLEVVEKWKDYLDKVKSVYYHFDSGTLIKIFDKTDYEKTIRELTQNKN